MGLIVPSLWCPAPLAFGWRLIRLGYASLVQRALYRNPHRLGARRDARQGGAPTVDAQQQARLAFYPLRAFVWGAARCVWPCDACDRAILLPAVCYSPRGALPIWDHRRRCTAALSARRGVTPSLQPRRPHRYGCGQTSRRTLRLGGAGKGGGGWATTPLASMASSASARSASPRVGGFSCARRHVSRRLTKSSGRKTVRRSGMASVKLLTSV